jgi:hypothetical protein
MSASTLPASATNQTLQPASAPALHRIESKFDGATYERLLRQYVRFIFRRRHGAMLIILAAADLLSLGRALFFGVENRWGIFLITTSICALLAVAALLQEYIRLQPLFQYMRMVRREGERTYVMAYDETSLWLNSAEQEFQYEWKKLGGYVEYRGIIFLVNRHRALETCVAPVLTGEAEFEKFREVVARKLKRIK